MSNSASILARSASRHVIHETGTNQFLRRFSETNGIGFVDERQNVAAGKRASNEFRLVLDDRTKACFAFLQGFTLAADHRSRATCSTPAPRRRLTR